MTEIKTWVYCKDCEYYHIEPSVRIVNNIPQPIMAETCMANAMEVRTYLGATPLAFERPHKKNDKNDCKDFKHKGNLFDIEKEKL